MLATLAILLAPGVAHASPRIGTGATGLRVDNLANPIGIDDATPALSWRLRASGRDQLQGAYQIQAATSERLLATGRPDLWDSGRVASPRSTGVAYAGRNLTSRQQVHWRVRVWDGHGRVTDWSRPASWEMGLLHTSDWSAGWIANRSWLKEPEPITVRFDRQEGRYVRIDVTRLGLPLLEGSSGPLRRLQLAEIVVEDSSDPATDLALHGGVVASERNATSGAWQPKFVTDGVLDTDATDTKGYTTNPKPSDDLSGSPAWIRVDLGGVRHFDTIKIYGRTDLVAEDGRTGDLPRDYTVRVGASADGPFTVATSVTDQQPTVGPHGQLRMPVFAKRVDVGKRIDHARLYISGLGMYEARLNGQPVTRSVLQPPQTKFDERAIYTTYDVTHELRRGENTLGVMLGNGYYNIPAIGGRYAWFRANGVPKLIAQLEITYADGSVRRVGSDDTWRTTDGPITFSSLYGGEDYDARAALPGWDRPGARHEGWDTAVATTAPGPDTVLSAQMQPGIEITDELHPVAVTQPKPGVYVFDLGTNIAGWPLLRVNGPAGTTVRIRPAERLSADGTIDTDGMGVSTDGPVTIEYDYTLAGSGRTETWHPRFSYHGFRYLQVTGLPAPPTKSTITGLVLRAANERAGTFDSSDALVDDIHRIIDRAIQGNMYGFLTDCPDREKMPWLEEVHLLFGVVARNYDVAAYYRNMVQNMADTQYGNGMVPSKAPAYTLSSGGFVDEPNWGSAIIMAPWEMYRYYGDRATLRRYYAPMQRYFGYLTGKAEGDLLDFGLGDWVAIDTSTPIGLTATYGYYRDAVTLQRIADVLGKSADAERYGRLADKIGAAFNAKYYDAAAKSYGSGSQSSLALALDMGVVPGADEQAVLDRLVASIRDAGDHLTVGEIGLSAIFRVLSEHGRDDVAFDVAGQTSHPSYGYQILHGATSLTEQWDGPTRGWSQNHFMLGAIDEWFTGGLAGIRQADDSVAFDKLDIKPAVVGDLARASGELTTPHGKVESAWRRVGRRYELTVTVPPNSTARVHVPLFGHGAAHATRGARRVGVEDDRAVYEVGSGRWRFTSSTGEVVHEDRTQLVVTSDRQDLPLLPGRKGHATFHVFNLMDHAVRVRPSITVPVGYMATADERSLTIPALSGTDVGVDVVREDPSAADGSLRVTLGDETATVPLTATDNWARIATMTASSTHSGWSPARTNDGDIAAQHDSKLWNGGDGWNDADKFSFPDWLRASWDEPVTIDRVVVRTLDAEQLPATRYGLRDYDVQALVGGEWRSVAEVRGTTAATIESTFDAVSTTALRLLVTDSNDHGYSRVVELEAYD